VAGRAAVVLLLLLAALAVPVLGSGTGAGQGGGVVGGVLVLGPGVHRVGGRLVVEGVLVLEPGAVLVFDPGSELVVKGRLVVEGSRPEPVVFASQGGFGAVRVSVVGGVVDAEGLVVRGVLVFGNVSGAVLRLRGVSVYYGEGPGPVVFNRSVYSSSIVFDSLRAARLLYGSPGVVSVVNSSFIEVRGSDLITLGFFDTLWRGVGLLVEDSVLHYGLVYRFVNASGGPLIEDSWVTINGTRGDVVAFTFSGRVGGSFITGMRLLVYNSSLEALGFTRMVGSRPSPACMLNESSVSVAGSRVGFVSVGGFGVALEYSSVNVSSSDIGGLSLAGSAAAANSSVVYVVGSHAGSVTIYSPGGVALHASRLSIGSSLLGRVEVYGGVGVDGGGSVNVSYSVFYRGGLNVSSAPNGTISVYNSSFIGSAYALAVNGSVARAEMHYCNMYGVGVGVRLGGVGEVDASLNWWGGAGVEAGPAGRVVVEPELPAPAGAGGVLNASLSVEPSLVGLGGGVRVSVHAPPVGRAAVGYVYIYGDGSSTGLLWNSSTTHYYSMEGRLNVTVRVLDNYGFWWNVSRGLLVCREEPVVVEAPRVANTTSFNVTWILGAHCNVSSVTVKVYRRGGGLVEELNATGRWGVGLSLPPADYLVVVEACSGPGYCYSSPSRVSVDTWAPRISVEAERAGNATILYISYSDDYNVTRVTVGYGAGSITFTPMRASGRLIAAVPPGSTVTVSCTDWAGHRTVRVFKAP